MTRDEENQIITDSLGFLRPYAFKLHFKSNRRVCVDDLIQYGSLGILQALRMNAGAGSLRTIAWRSMIDGIRDETHRGHAPKGRPVDYRDRTIDPTSAIEARLDVESGLRCLSASMRLMIIKRLDGMTQREVAEHAGRTPVWGSWCEREALKRIRKGLAIVA